MHLKCKDWKRFWPKTRLQRVPEWPSYNNFRKVTQNPNFLKKCKGGTKGNFSKNRPKSSPRLKGLKAHWRKWHYPLICTHLKCKDWRIFWRKHRLQTVFEWASYDNYRKITQNPHFLKKERRGDQGKFLKNRPKSSPRLKGLKALWRKWHYPLISIRSKCKDWARFWRKKWLKECRNCQVIAIFAWSPKSRIFGKSLKGGPGEIFQKSPRK